MILVYSASYVVEEVLLHTMSRGVQLRVIVADAGPKFEGRELMQRLMGAGLRCTYVNLHALSYMMPEVSKLLLGASSMLLNGTLLARAGTALVSMLAHEHGVPVLVCCETYKFAERVLLDSICFNEVRAAHALPTRLPHACLAPASRLPRARLAPASHRLPLLVLPRWRVDSWATPMSSSRRTSALTRRPARRVRLAPRRRRVAPVLPRAAPPGRLVSPTGATSRA